MSVVRAFHGDKAANSDAEPHDRGDRTAEFQAGAQAYSYNVLEQIVLRVTAVAVTLLSIWFSFKAV